MLSNVCQAQTAGPVTHVQGLATLPFECIWQACRTSRQQIHLFIQLCRCQIMKHHCWFETCVTDIAQETTALLFKLLNSDSFWLSLLGLRQGKTQRQSRAQAAPWNCSISSSLRRTTQRLCNSLCHHGRPLGQPCTTRALLQYKRTVGKSGAEKTLSGMSSGSRACCGLQGFAQ